MVFTSESRQLRTLQSLVDEHLSCFELELAAAVDEPLSLDVSRQSGQLLVKEVRDGPVSRWNNSTLLAAQGRRAKVLQAGDGILAVNRIRGEAEELLGLLRKRSSGPLALLARSHAGSGIKLEDLSWTDYAAMTGDKHLVQAYRCLVTYQQQRHGGGTRNIDPRTRFVELLKLWLRKCAAAEPTLGRVELYAQLCGDVCQLGKLFPQRNKLSFLGAIGQVREQLEVYLSLRGRSLCWTPLPKDAYESSQETTASEKESLPASESELDTASEPDVGCGHSVPVLLEEQELGGLSRSSSCASMDILVLPQLLIDTE